MMRFLRYSLEKGRRIRAMLMVEGKLVQQPVTVLALTDEQATLMVGQRKKPLTLPVADILSCDYARGDNGED
ncbi:MAG: hypothetical protein E7331_05830 [Clostridiales bacterium]|nr:hypothetical protein [Clostridiales bacterium]